MPTDENLDPMPTNGHASTPIGKSAKTEDAPGSVPMSSSQGEEAGSRPLTEDELKEKDAKRANNPPKPPDTENENGQSEPPPSPNPATPPPPPAPNPGMPPVIPPPPGVTPVD
jgi:hypothetical protein